MSTPEQRFQSFITRVGPHRAVALHEHTSTHKTMISRSKMSPRNSFFIPFSSPIYRSSMPQSTTLTGSSMLFAPESVWLRSGLAVPAGVNLQERFFSWRPTTRTEKVPGIGVGVVLQFFGGSFGILAEF